MNEVYRTRRQWFIRDFMMQTQRPVSELATFLEAFDSCDISAVTEQPEVVISEEPEEPELTEETLPGEESSKPAISAEDTATISRYSSEQQVAIILTKVGLIDALTSSNIRIKDLAVKAADGITSDLSSLLVEETLTIDGEEHVWKVITLIENGKTVKYCFRQLEDGTWIYKKISE